MSQSWCARRLWGTCSVSPEHHWCIQPCLPFSVLVAFSCYEGGSLFATHHSTSMHVHGCPAGRPYSSQVHGQFLICILSTVYDIAVEDERTDHALLACPLDTLHNITDNAIMKSAACNVCIFLAYQKPCSVRVFFSTLVSFAFLSEQKSRCRSSKLCVQRGYSLFQDMAHQTCQDRCRAPCSGISPHGLLLHFSRGAI
jgi:hypothetical protein